MTAAKQLGEQIKRARQNAGLSLRKLGSIAQIPATTIEGYEAGASVPAEKLAKIAKALNHFTFRIDGYHFTVTSEEKLIVPPTSDQIKLDFNGEYGYAKAQVKIGPGRITIHLNGLKSPITAGR